MNSTFDGICANTSRVSVEKEIQINFIDINPLTIQSILHGNKSILRIKYYLQPLTIIQSILHGNKCVSINIYNIPKHTATYLVWNLSYLVSNSDDSNTKQFDVYTKVCSPCIFIPSQNEIIPILKTVSLVWIQPLTVPTGPVFQFHHSNNIWFFCLDTKLWLKNQYCHLHNQHCMATNVYPEINFTYQNIHLYVWYGAFLLWYPLWYLYQSMFRMLYPAKEKLYHQPKLWIWYELNLFGYMCQ